jgi:hypothetical protein
MTDQPAKYDRKYPFPDVFCTQVNEGNRKTRAEKSRNSKKIRQERGNDAKQD